MAAERKLKAEIQQTLKKAEEGIEVFEDILSKVYASEQQNQKEKFETELKKEIKKLQRHRDQIKAWLGSNEVKEKDQLTKMRKIIEEKMEQFKACEKDTKIKAYSREGLARDSKSDPQDAEREEKRAWVTECMDKVDSIIEGIEGEKDKLSRQKAKSKDKELLEKFENRIKKLKWHKGRMELLLEKLDNEDFNPSNVDNVKELVEDYLANASEDDGSLDVADEFDIYEELNLDGDEDENGASDGDDAPETPTSDVKTSNGGGAPTKVTKAETIPIATSTVAKLGVVKPGKPVALVAAASPNLATAAKVSGVVPSTVTNTKAATGPVTTAASLVKPGAPGKSTATTTPSSKETESPKPAEPVPNSWLNTLAAKAPIANANKANATAPSASAASPGQTSSQVSQQPAVQPQANNNLKTSPVMQPTQVAESKATSNSSTDSSVPVNPNAPISHATASPATASITPSASTAKPNNGIDLSNPFWSSLCQSALYSEADVPSSSSYKPTQAIQTHSAFPQQPLDHMNTPEAFDRLPLDSLMYAFYYQQGSNSQYLASRKLKNTSWRFHKYFCIWFQRLDEPKVKNSEYEEGNYKYFSFDDGWCTRPKPDFKMEYSKIEE